MDILHRVLNPYNYPLTEKVIETVDSLGNPVTVHLVSRETTDEFLDMLNSLNGDDYDYVLDLWAKA